MSTELSIVPFRRLELAWEIDPTFIEKRDEAVGLASLVTVVNSIESNESASKIAKECGELRRLAQKAYKEAKAPILQCARELDAKLADAIDALSAEEARLSEITGDYISGIEKQRMAALAAAEAIAKGEQNAMQEALSKASTIDEQIAIREEFELRAQAASKAVPISVRAPGQSLKPSWEIEITSVHELVAWAVKTGMTAMLKVEIRKTEIVGLLDKGIVIPGIKAEKVNKTQVR